MLALRENTTATPQRYGLGIQFSSEWAARTPPRATAFVRPMIERKSNESIKQEIRYAIK